MKRRLDMLDGLRGLAIVFVFLNHIDSHFIADAVPLFLKPVIQFFFTSGYLGVSFFFILSGFLMGYLYTNPQPREFIERRYARIFPPLLVMTTCMWLFRLYPTTPLILRICLMFGIALIVRFIWIQVVERFHKGSLFITLFLLFQVCVALWYGFFIMRKPPIWFDSLPFLLKEITVFATNFTLTLPFGDYIPMIDGVYWSLIPEVIFYLIYPIIFAPAVAKLLKKNKAFIFFFIFSLFPFFFGISLLFEHVRNFKMLFIEYYIYFCVGIFVAVLAKKGEIHLPMLVKKIFNPVIIFPILIISHLNLTSVPLVSNLVSRILWSVPLGFIVYGLLDETTALTRFFSQKNVIFLGTISYSMYITHTALVDGMHLLFRPTNALTNILFLVLTAIIFLCVAFGIHNIIETPYFMFKPKKKEEKKITMHPRLVHTALLLFFIFVFFTSYTSQFNFFSSEYIYDSQTIFSQQIPKKIVLKEEPLLLTFTAKENKLGILAFHLEYNPLSNPSPYASNTQEEQISIRIREKGQISWHATQQVSPAKIGKSEMYPFGFPTIEDSKNKQYEVELSLTNPNKHDEVYLYSTPSLFSTVHQLDKKTVMTNPTMLFAHLGTKLTAILYNKEALIVMLTILPTLLLLFVLSYVS